MHANPWELRADVRPLEIAAERWSDIGRLMTSRAEQLVDAARHATDGWDAAAAESFDAHRREVLMNLDRFTTLADEMAGTLLAVAGMVQAGQRELDRSWATVALVPHDVVGESRQLVFRPDHDEDRGAVSRAESGADEIRNRLGSALASESARLRATRAELVSIHTELQRLNSTGFPTAPVGSEGETGVGSVVPGTTSVPGSAQSGVVAGLPPVAPIGVSMPDLGGIDGTALAPLGAAGAAALRAARSARPATAGTPPVGGMGAGAMGARAGSASRSAAVGRTGGRSGARPGAGRAPATPRLADEVDDEQTRAARERAAEKDAKRATLEEKRADRAARRAARAARREEREDDEDASVSEQPPGDDREAERR